MSAILSRRALLLALTAAASPRLWAEGRPEATHFQVEVVLFTQPGTPPRAVPVGMRTPAITSPGKVERLAGGGRWQLAGAREAIARHGGYQILGHAAWTAAVAANGRTTARLEDVLKGGTAALAGSITLQRSQQLFLGVDVDYLAAGDGVYRLRERRRVKFGDRHYFDHPAFGAIALVTPVPGEIAPVTD